MKDTPSCDALVSGVLSQAGCGANRLKSEHRHNFTILKPIFHLNFYAYYIKPDQNVQPQLMAVAQRADANVS